VGNKVVNDREAILGAIQDRRGRELPPPWPGPVVEGDLVARFTTELNTLGAEVITLDRLSEVAGQSAFADEDVPAEFVKGINRTEQVWDAEVGFTLADYAIADTGSLVLNAGPGRRRLASLAPPHHIAIVSRSKILPASEAAIAALTSRTTVFITGPSRTADIEGVIVRGIHGPRRLWVLITD
jgi:L-lactate dehydrogenase complex protein LldG